MGVGGDREGEVRQNLEKGGGGLAIWGFFHKIGGSGPVLQLCKVPFYLRYPNFHLKVGLSASKKADFICFKENALKMIKNAF